MNIEELLNKKKIKRIEDLTNEIYSAIMLIDSRFIKSSGNIDQTGSINAVQRNLDELWNNYWAISKSADNIKVRYIGLGRADNITEVLQHLMMIYHNIFMSKLRLDILSANWINFSINHKLWKNVWNN